MNQKLKKLIIFLITTNFIFPAYAFPSILNQQKIPLKFKDDKTFKIVQFTDVQDGPNMDFRTVSLMNKILDYEKPDLVVFTGDNVDIKCKSREDVKKAINNIAKPLETRSVPWAVVFGNHDEEHKLMTRKEMLEIYMSYPHNISKPGDENIEGVGNYCIGIFDSKFKNPAFNVFMLDSGNDGLIRPSQIEWYNKLSLQMKRSFRKNIPALMFFHIPIPEIKQAWEKNKISGEKNEEECVSNTPSEFFNSVLKNKNVKGIFFGHDHINDYVGELKGIRLGYSRNVGYATYGKEGISRGARVFLIKESNPGQFETWMRLESDFK